MSITLCGFSLSNYYNKVKLALLEKNLPFSEEIVRTGLKDEAVLSCSPLGKIPFIRTEHGALCESQAILDYLEQLQPQPALMPADAWASAKVRELSTFIEQYLELVARQLYPQAFFGGTLAAGVADSVRPQLEKNIAACKRLLKLAPYAAGESFTQADCAAYVHLPVVGMATRIIYGEDMLLAAGIDWKSYIKLVGSRASAQRVDADRKADTTMKR